MTKPRIYTVILVLAAVIISYFLRKENSSSPAPSAQPPSVVQPSSTKSNDKPLEIDGKKVIGLSPGKEAEEIKNLKVANTYSPEWQEHLEDSLRVQGGSALKDIEIQKSESFIWAQDGIALHVESAILTLKNAKNEETTFRVLVDAQTGKVLRNWDRPVIDPMNPRENFGIKVDPRYHND